MARKPPPIAMLGELHRERPAMAGRFNDFRRVAVGERGRAGFFPCGEALHSGDKVSDLFDELDL